MNGLDVNTWGRRILFGTSRWLDGILIPVVAAGRRHVFEKILELDSGEGLKHGRDLGDH